MRKHLGHIIILLALATFLLSGWTIIAQRQSKRATTLRQPVWEYKITGPVGEKEMNALGAQGWELAGATAYVDNSAFYFKRRKE